MKPKHFGPVKHCMYCSFCDERVGDESIYETLSYCSKHDFVISRCDKYACDSSHDYVCDDWKEQNIGLLDEMEEQCQNGAEDLEESIISTYMKNIRNVYQKGKKFILK